MDTTVAVHVGALSFADVVAVARGGATVEIAEDALDAMAASRTQVERLAASGRPVYGISTGFGSLATRYIEPSMRKQLQRSLIRSHAAGTGPPVEDEVVRAMMLLRLSSLCSGYSGVRVETATAYAALINHHITPQVPEYGSLGCSGDLAPLSHCALAMTGEGLVSDAEGRVVPAAEALEVAGLTPVALEEKEGLALINGTDGMLGTLVLAVADLRALLQAADVAAAMSVESLLGTDRVFDAGARRAALPPGAGGIGAQPDVLARRVADRRVSP